MWKFTCLALLLPTSLLAQEKPKFLQPGKRILFLGDSNTYAGQYIVQLEAQLRARNPGQSWELINLGLPSETASGLSEPDHPFPRPDVHERAERALKKLKPDVVFVCYGMNDGIYYPLSDKRFAAYQKGIENLVKKIKAVGAKVVLMTPPPFDPVPLKKKNKLRAAGAEKYAWFAPYEKYNEVLARYAKWIMTQKGQVDQVIDIYTPIQNHLDAQRKTKPDYTLSGDGVHPNQKGHQLIAEAILRALGYQVKKVKPEVVALVGRRSFLLRDAWLTEVGHKRPGVKKGLKLEEALKQSREMAKKLP